MAIRYADYNGKRGMIRGVRDGKLFILWEDDTADWVASDDVTFI